MGQQGIEYSIQLTLNPQKKVKSCEEYHNDTASENYNKFAGYLGCSI